MMNKPNPYSRASVNFSILEKGFKPADIYRFWCLSLCRDIWYNVHVTLEEIMELSGDKSLSSFNKHFKEYLHIKPYYIENNYRYLTKRNVYHIPRMEKDCITISREFLSVDLDAKTKGFYIQLLLLERYGNMELSKKNIIHTLKMDKKTYDKYLALLMVADLVKPCSPIKPDTSRFILENDFSYQKATSQKEQQEINEWINLCAIKCLGVGISCVI